MLNVKLKHFREEITKREQIARIYTENLAHLNSKALILPIIPQGYTSVYAQYSVRLLRGEREAVLEALQHRGVPTAVHYPLPLHLQESFAYLGYTRGDFPVSEQIAREIFSLPFSAFLDKQEQSHIIESLNAILS